MAFFIFMEKEIWKEAKGFESLLIVSTHGNVIRLPKYQKHWKGGFSIVKESVCSYSYTKKINGYKQVKISTNNVKKSVLVHRLVAETFLPKVEGKEYINHKDGNKLNNTLCNLEWCTMKENKKHAIDNGLWVARKGFIGKRGNDCKTSKKVKKIKYGNCIGIYDNARIAAESIGKPNGTHINAVCNKKRKSAYGYNWEFA